MSHSKVALAVGVALVATATACADEDPTGLGSGLLPGDVDTIELLLDASTFLVNDTSVGGFTDPSDASFILVARDFGGEVNAHTLLRFGSLPTSVTYEDEEGVNRTDSDPTFIGGSLVLRTDSLSMTANSGNVVTVQLSTLGQAWDPADASWEERRVDDDDEEQAWSQPGGTPGDLSFDAEWDASADSIIIPVDSQAVATIFDEENDARGVLIRSMTDDTRFRVTGVTFHLEAIPSASPEDVVTAEVDVNPSQGVGEGLAIFDAPESALAEGELRAGGLTGWRTVLQFNPRLDTLVVPCPGGPDGCEISLSGSTISMAALVLEPLPVPRAFEPEDTLTLEPHLLLVADNVPPNRAPVGNQVASPHVLEPGVFAPDGSGEDVSIPLTSFISNLTGERSDDGGSPPSNLALISCVLTPNGCAALPSANSVGYAAFGGTRMPEGSGVVGPRLRILVTTVDLGGVR